VKCSDCGRLTTKEQLFEENSENIDANVEDFKKEIMKEVNIIPHHLNIYASGNNLILYADNYSVIRKL
jgi:hypothetical protein